MAAAPSSRVQSWYTASSNRQAACTPSYAQVCYEELQCFVTFNIKAPRWTLFETISEQLMSSQQIFKIVTLTPCKILSNDILLNYEGARSGCILHVFLTSVFDKDEWSDSCPNSFGLEERTRYPLDRRLNAPQGRSRSCG